MIRRNIFPSNNKKKVKIKNKYINKMIIPNWKIFFLITKSGRIIKIKTDLWNKDPSKINKIEIKKVFKLLSFNKKLIEIKSKPIDIDCLV